MSNVLNGINRTIARNPVGGNTSHGEEPRIETADYKLSRSA
jgi:hypothetical protein